jgi:hypothetical protein
VWQSPVAGVVMDVSGRAAAEKRGVQQGVMRSML